MSDIKENLDREESMKTEETEKNQTITESTPVAEPETSMPEAAEETVTIPAENTVETTEPEAEVTASAPAEETIAEETEEAPDPETKGEVIARLKELVQNEESTIDRQELESLKQIFYRIYNEEQSNAREAFIANGGEAEAFQAGPDEDEENFKAQMQVLKERRAKAFEALEQARKDNLDRKLAIIEEIKELITTPDEANRSYQKFRALQNEWKEIKLIPAEKANELWKNYQLYVEQFYDLLKQNNEMREYDFRKNLEIKTHICETSEKLTELPDVISAFHQLQELHQEFRETGPVAKELREDIWNRFKAASTIINKRHANYFEELKSKEEENETKKTELCERVEAIEIDKVDSFTEWDKITQAILAIQAEWKQIGMAPKKVNTKLYKRFREACDNFFQHKLAFFKERKETFAANMAKKVALCEQAEALKDSTEWASTTNKIIQLQKDWKTIGPVARKQMDSIWKRFNEACNFFFDHKNEATGEQRKQEAENMAAKQTIIEKLKAISIEGGENAAQKVRDLIDEWNKTGHVPFKEKDKLYNKFHELVDGLFKEFNIQGMRRRVDSFKERIREGVKEGGDALSSERNRLFRAFEAKKSEILTYENNLGFLSSKSKSGNSLVNEMNKKVDHLKEELDLLQQKIAAIDEEVKAKREGKKEEPAKED